MRREFSSGGVVFKRCLALRAKKLKTQNSKFKILWLVTKSTASKLYPKSVWRLPKGWLDDEDNGKNPGPMASGLIKASESDLKDAALKEVKEEGGVKAKIIKKIGTEKYFRKEKKETIVKFVTFYLMEWVKDSREGFGLETEEIAWLSDNKARERLSYSGERIILDKAKNLLKDLQKQPLLL
ncbi:hypothetical protein A2Z22_02735 [Candidatus Woesebacteria bacterium RBG_16_34_12]|uniref:Nudix hydrolase domain-containing protein n=1 Tax=Candidatus Woesebacteria bacterium RBG_16_34_12 TaxID=1802480 RepID=A0A1F7X721_9BACT|nr:MAG: hypothetical protein A2Z22_02735 [Candidatus Woesebacteria bacterium RBG_16_34_12]